DLFEVNMRFATMVLESDITELGPGPALGFIPNCFLGHSAAFREIGDKLPVDLHEGAFVIEADQHRGPLSDSRTHTCLCLRQAIETTRAMPLVLGIVDLNFVSLVHSVPRCLRTFR